MACTVKYNNHNVIGDSEVTLVRFNKYATLRFEPDGKLSDNKKYSNIDIAVRVVNCFVEINYKQSY